MQLSGWAINAFVKNADVGDFSFQARRATNIAVRSTRMPTRKQGGKQPIPNGPGSKRGGLERKRDAQRRVENHCVEKAHALDLQSVGQGERRSKRSGGCSNANVEVQSDNTPP